MTITIDGTVGANKAVVLDSSGKLPVIDGSLVTTLNATQVTTGSIATARLDTGTTNGKVLVLDGSGNMPAIAAGAMTGVESATKSSSNPTVSTNSALGTKWINTTTGAIFILTDATAGDNVWTNTGGTSGDVKPFAFQGTIAGYTYGGYNHPNAARAAGYDRHSFTTDGNGTDVGNMASGNPGRGQWAGCSSTTHGYQCGGYGPGAYSPNTANVIEKHGFVAEGNCVDVGDLVNSAKINMSSSSSGDYGYCAGGGRAANDPTGPAAIFADIERFSYASDGNSVDLGDLTTNRDNATGHSDPENSYGYTGGGYDGAQTNRIERYAQSSSASGADVGDLIQAGTSNAGSSSTTHGYVAAGYEGQNSNVIERFAFASSANGADVGDLLHWAHNCCGISSTTHGYCIGGGVSGSPGSVDIMKFAFASSANATDVGDLTLILNSLGRVGTQY